MNKTIIVFPDTTKMADFIFSRQLPNTEANTQQCSVTASMQDDDIIDAVADYRGYVTEDWPPLFSSSC